jgi:chromate transport protein ChrA
MDLSGRLQEGLALAQLAPGPLAAQLAIYLGWVRGGLVGATLAGIAFVVPSFLMVLALAFMYLRLGGLPWMQGMFYGTGAAVLPVRGALGAASLDFTAPQRGATLAPSPLRIAE